MNLFLGNCQAEGIYRAYIRSNNDAKLFITSSFNFSNENGLNAAKKLLTKKVSQTDYRQLLMEGFLVPQPSYKDLFAYSYNMIVLTLFHDRPSFYSKKNQFFFTHAGSEELKALRPHLYKWIEESCGIAPKSMDYIQDFKSLLKKLSTQYKGKPIVIIKRFSHRKILGDFHCSNAWWSKKWRNWHKYEGGLLRKFPNLHIIDLNKIISGLAATHRVEEIFPNIFLKQANDGHKLINDSEHLGSAVWERVAEILLQFEDRGKIIYKPKERNVDFSALRKALFSDANNFDQLIQELFASGELLQQRSALSLLLKRNSKDIFSILLKFNNKLQFHYRFFKNFELAPQTKEKKKLCAELKKRNNKIHPVGSFRNELFKELFNNL